MEGGSCGTWSREVQTNNNHNNHNHNNAKPGMRGAPRVGPRRVSPLSQGFGFWEVWAFWVQKIWPKHWNTKIAKVGLVRLGLAKVGHPNLGQSRGGHGTSTSHSLCETRRVGSDHGPWATFPTGADIGCSRPCNLLPTTSSHGLAKISRANPRWKNIGPFPHQKTGE